MMSNADGMILPRPDYYMNETGQKAVIFHENGMETMVLSVSFSGDAKDFAWVIPIPSKPEVTKGSDEIFTSLAEITRPVLWRGPMPMMELAGKANDEQAVIVVETKKVDYYDITVLQATDSGALAKWLNQNDYEYPEESGYILNDYIENNWYFIAVKINTSAVEADEVGEGLKQGHATPLKIEFASSAIIYPLRISSITTQPKVVQISDNLYLDGPRIAHLKKIGYGDLIRKTTGEEVINQIIEDLVNQVPYEDSKASDYPLIIAKEKNYPTAESWKYAAGLDENYYRPQLEKFWFNAYFNRQGLYYEQNSHQYAPNIPIHLYVLADHKKDIPGFTTSYADKIKKNQIQDLAYDIKGEPLIQPAQKKYWLTYLYRHMMTSEMTNDLVIRDADDNDKVGAGSPVRSWQWLQWLIIYMVSVIGWLFSPFGLIFIGFSLLQFLSKNRKAQAIAWVFQLLSLVVTLGIFGVLFFWAMRVGWYEIMAIYSPSWSAFSYSYALPISFAVLTIFVACIIVMILQWRQHRRESGGNTPGSSEGPKEPVKLAKEGVSRFFKRDRKESIVLPKAKKVVMLVW